MFRRSLSGAQVFLAAHLFITGAAAGAQDRPDSAPQRLFESDEVLHLRLVTDLNSIVKDDADEQPAMIAYSGSGGVSVALEVTVTNAKKAVEVRPGMRGPQSIYLLRDRNICKFPSLGLDFEENQTQGTVFENQAKLKLLTHCQDKKKEYEQYVLQQYLIYRTYNLVTDWGFRVRLARVTYVDTAGRRDSLTKYAVLIEDEHVLATRLGGEILDMQGLHPLDLESTTMTGMALFEFMILNTDWGVSGLHNVKLVASQGLGYPIPYDFAWSGVIGAPFAKPDRQLLIGHVRDRLYRGFCRTAAEFGGPVREFNRHKDAIYEMHRNQEGLDPKLMERMLNDYDEFYEIINDPQRMQREILGKCRPDTR